MTDTIPQPILFDWALIRPTIRPIPTGLIHRTFRVDSAQHPPLAFQRLHPIFQPTVNLDIDAITQHLAARGVPVPRLVPNRHGALWSEHDGIWRALTWMDGAVIERVTDPTIAYHAGHATAAFHRAAADFSHTFHFARTGVHDTARHLQRLRTCLDTFGTHPSHSQLTSLATNILTLADTLEPIPPTPIRIVHGDLKISNFLFTPDHTSVNAILDLDTVSHSSIPIELGDALRSWSNPHGEDHEHTYCDPTIVDAALRGYATLTQDWIEPVEHQSIILATLTIALELAARFCTDAFEDTYFGWNPQRFSSRTHHNTVRARGQLSLAQSIAAQRSALESAVTRTFSTP